MGKIEKTFWWLCFILAIYTTIGFKLIPGVLKDQLIKNLDENLTLKSSIEKIEFNPYSLTAKIYNYKLGVDKPTASFDKLTLDLGLIRSLTDLHANVQEVKIEKLYLDVIEQKDGTFNLTKLLKPSTKEKPVENEESSSDIKFLVSKLILENSKIDFTKQKDKEPYKLTINNLNYKLRDFGTYENSLSSNDLEFKINKFTKLSVEGAFRLIPFKMYGKTKLEDLRVKELLDYDMSSFNFAINKEANVNIDLDFNIDTTKQTDVKLDSSNININNLNIIKDNSNLISLNKFAISKLNFDLLKQSILINNPSINALNMNLVQNKNGLNISNLIKSTQTKDEINETKEKVKTTEESKPWILKVKNTNLQGINVNFNDVVNSMIVSSKNSNIKLSTININGSIIDLNQLSLTAPTLNFKDNKNALNIDTKNLAINLNKLDLHDNKTSIDNLKLNTGNLSFKDKSSIKINSSKNTINISDINLAGSDIKIKKVDTTLSNINFDELKSKLNIKSNQTKLVTNDIKINGSKININNANLNIPVVNVADRLNKIKVDVKSTNLAINTIALNGSDIDVKTIKLSRPDINFQDSKNNLSLKTQDLQVYVNRFSQKGTQLRVNSIRVVQPKLNFLNTENKTNILASNIDLSVSKIYNSNNLLKVNSTTLNRPKISVILPKSTQEKKEETAKKKEAKKDSEVKNKNGKKIEIGPIKIKNGELNFEDKNLPIAFKTTVSKLNGTISEFKSDRQSTSKLQVKGVVDKYGTTRITGIVNPNSIKVLTDINMIFKNIAMENFTPYTGKFIGRELASGKLDLDLKYNIQKSDLKAQNNIIINKLELGDKVESKDAVSLPLELAIALLEDRSGIIDLSLPISGNVDDPQFSIAPIVWKAFVNLITKALTAPFSLLGAVFGFDADEIKSVNFDYGQSEITPIQKETLDKISKILTKRPNIVLKLQPAYDSSKDLYALKKAKFERFVNNELPNKSDKDYKEDYIDLLEDLYEDFDKKTGDLEDKYTKNDKLDVNAYKKEMEEFIINKQNIETKDIEKMAKLRVVNIKKYLVKDKAIPTKQIDILKDIKIKSNTAKTSNIDLKIDNI